MKNGDVGMAKHLSKKYVNKGWAFEYHVSAIWNKCLLNKSSVKKPVNARCYIPTSLPPNHHKYCTILSQIQALDTNRPVVSLAEAGL